MEGGRHTTERTDERRCTRTRQSVTMDGGRHTTERADKRRHTHSRRNDGRGMHTTGGSAEGVATKHTNRRGLYSSVMMGRGRHAAERADERRRANSRAQRQEGYAHDWSAVGMGARRI